MTAEILWNFKIILIRIPISGNVDTQSDGTGNLMEFFKIFDQNTDGKFQGEIHQKNSNFLRAMQSFVFENRES